MIEHLLYEILLDGILSLAIISYPVTLIVNFAIEKREKKYQDFMEANYGRRRLYVQQDGNPIYYRRLTAVQAKLLSDALNSQDTSTESKSVNDTEVCQIILSCVSGSVDREGKRNLVNAPLKRLSLNINNDFSINLDLKIENDNLTHDNLPSA